MTQIVIDIKLCIDCPYSRTDNDDSSILICDSEKKRFPNKMEQKVPSFCKRKLSSEKEMLMHFLEKYKIFDRGNIPVSQLDRDFVNNYITNLKRFKSSTKYLKNFSSV